MDYWLTTRWPAKRSIVSAAPNVTLMGVRQPTGPKPGDRILICRFEPDWEVLPEARPPQPLVPQQWPRPEGMIVVALVIAPPDDDGKRRPLCIGRDGDCWLRILDMRLPSYDKFDPEADILQVIGMGENGRGALPRTALAGLIRLNSDQFNRLLELFGQRQLSS